jgi:regulatory protein
VQGPSADAIAVGIRALSRKELTGIELQSRLERAGVDAGEATRVVLQLREAGYQSDARAASERARVLGQRNLGDAAIAHDLEQRGLSAAIIEAALAELPTERDRAQAIAVRGRHGSKLAQTLRRRGFSAETVASIVGAIADED